MFGVVLFLFQKTRLDTSTAAEALYLFRSSLTLFLTNVAQRVFRYLKLIPKLAIISKFGIENRAEVSLFCRLRVCTRQV